MKPAYALLAVLVLFAGLAAIGSYLSPLVRQYRVGACRFERLQDGEIVGELEFLNARECSKRGGYPL